jgi:hypothetical protein
MRHSLWFVLAISVACTSPQLTRDQAAELLSKSPALSGIQNLRLVTPSGCFTLDRDAEVRAADVQRDQRLNELSYIRDALDRDLELGLIELEFSEATAGSPKPQGCDQQLWTAYKSDRFGELDRRLKLVAWKAVPSDKANAAGLHTGQTFLYRRQALIAITKLVRQDDHTSVVEYSWNWAPTYEGLHLGISASPPITSKATFKRSDTGWRFAP